MLKKRPAFFIFEFPRGSFPLEKLAHGFGQFSRAEVGEIAGDFADEIEVSRRERPAGKFQAGLQHDWAPAFPH
jgi:hypothetical protein